MQVLYFALKTLPIAYQGKVRPQTVGKVLHHGDFDKVNCPQKQHCMNTVALNGALKMVFMGDRQKTDFWW